MVMSANHLMKGCALNEVMVDFLKFIDARVA